MTYWEPLQRKTVEALDKAEEIPDKNKKPWDDPKMSDKFSVVLTRKQIILLKVMIAHSRNNLGGPVDARQEQQATAVHLRPPELPDP